MNRKELIEKLLLKFSYGMSFDYFKQILEEELPDFQRIDEERLLDCFGSLFTSFVRQHLSNSIQEYNSTLPPALVPLPKEMPKWFHNGISYHDLWSMVCLNYGTPEPKPSLPTVEELRDKMYRWVGSVDLDECEILAQNLHEKYSLPTREWWQGDIKGMKVKLSTGEVKELDGSLYARTGIGSFISINAITPYTPPSAQDIIAKHNLSEEEVKAIREGK